MAEQIILYHAVPENMVGDVLVPLGQMRGPLEAVKVANLKKYQGREEVLQRTLPYLNCKWNDVLQFLPLNPQKIFDLQKELGLIDEVPPYRFFEIPLELLVPTDTVVFLKTASGEENTDVKPLNDIDLSTLAEVPEATRLYYETLVGTGELPFNYQFVPHVMYKGVIDVAGLGDMTLKNRS